MTRAKTVKTTPRPCKNEQSTTHQSPAAGRYMVLFAEGKRLSYKQAVLAKCFECMDRYKDGLTDCQISGCPLYPFMPYRKKTP